MTKEELDQVYKEKLCPECGNAMYLPKQKYYKGANCIWVCGWCDIDIRDKDIKAEWLRSKVIPNFHVEEFNERFKRKLNRGRSK